MKKICLFLFFTIMLLINVKALSIEKIYEDNDIKLMINNDKNETINSRLSDFNLAENKGFFIECLPLTLEPNSQGVLEYSKLINYGLDTNLDSTNIYMSQAILNISDNLIFSNSLELGNISKINLTDFSKVKVYNLCQEKSQQDQENQEDQQESQQQSKQSQEEEQKTLEELQQEKDELEKNMQEMQETYDKLSDIEKKQNYAQTTQKDPSLNSIKESLESQKKKDAINNYENQLKDRENEKKFQEMMQNEDFLKKVQEYQNQGYEIKQKFVDNETAKVEFEKDGEHQEIQYNKTSNEMIDTKDYQNNYPQEKFDNVDNRISNNQIQSQLSNKNMNISINTSLENNISNISFSDVLLEKEIFANKENEKLINKHNELLKEYNQSQMQFYKDGIRLDDLSNIKNETLELIKTYYSDNKEIKLKGENKYDKVLNFSFSNEKKFLLFWFFLSILVIIIGLIAFKKIRNYKNKKSELKVVKKIKYFYYILHAKKMYKLSKKTKGKDKLKYLSKALKSYLLFKQYKKKEKPIFWTNKKAQKITKDIKIRQILKKIDEYVYSRRKYDNKLEDEINNILKDKL